jgi:hypothetical protein
VMKDWLKNQWYKKPLDIASDNPAVGYKVLAHDYIVDPPQWVIDYYLSVQTSDGKTLWESMIRYRDSKMPTWYCVDGKLINKRSLKCEGPIELEPGQQGYGTPGPNPY